ncbi:MAG: carboxypeptidase M32, partial [Thermodesulfatator sp.]
MVESRQYQELSQRFKKIAFLKSTASLLSWDQETYMPESGQEHRAGQLSTISGIVHSILVEQRTGELIGLLYEQAKDMEPDSDLFVNLREWKRVYEQAVKLPEELVRELSYTRVLAHGAWIEARAKSDFSVFQPHLEKLVQLSRKKAIYLGFEENMYDALLDLYEPGEKTANIEAIFAALVPGLKDILSFVVARQGKMTGLEGVFPVESQKVLARLMASRLGYDFSAGRLDTVVHPFSTRIGPGDVRITTRWNERDFTDAIFGVLHEAGHGVYSQNLPSQAYGTPLGDSVSLGIHESQSRLWENIVGRSMEFWEYFLPVAKGIFPEALKGMGLVQFVRLINRVRPSYIRVEADEVTYNLHVFLRFQMEKEIINGHIKVNDIPARWNELFEEIFDIKVPDDSRGCLQDVHWSGAAFGYFPTYTLGNIYSAMIFQAASRDIPDLRRDFAKGDFSVLLKWLSEKIYSQGQR